MQRIIGFFLKYKYFLFFIFLQIIAFSLTIKSHSFHRSKFVNSANAISGSIYMKVNAIEEYFYLKTYNEQLLNENVRLKNQLALRLKDSTIWLQDSTKYKRQFSYTAGKIIHNQFRGKFNYLTLNKGKNDGVEPDQAVINSLGIIGITNTVNEKYATVLSILNGNAKINVKLKKSAHFGTMAWDGIDYNTVQIIDLPIQANIQVGDSIITGGKSTIFPDGIPVGIIKDFQKENNEYTSINVKLHNDMSAIGPVFIIKNADKDKILEIEQTIH
ncbi:rod shape-determining protein MreC [Flavobacteriaceae bacterium F08102]|nr:rod shape-determining protein MreC [Flavobacteriaceae bacterium F08102]